jgi:hypothetical protein
MADRSTTGPSAHPFGVPMPDGASKTWVSFESMELDRWKHIQPRLDRMFPANRPFGKASPFLPRSSREFIQHRLSVLSAKAKLTRRQLAQAERERTYDGYSQKITEVFGGKKFGSLAAGVDGEGLNASPNPPNRGPVLGQHTIWCGPSNGPPLDIPWREQADWPCLQEMQWEGDQRVATENGRYGRFLALPRETHDEAPWHLRPRLMPYSMDEVWRVPTEEDICAPVEEIDDPEIMAQCLNKEVLDALDDFI